MNSFIKPASQAEIVRTTQKDSQFTEKINENVAEILQQLSHNRFHLIRYSELSNILSQIFYHGFASINRLQTLGEEYTGVIQIQGNSVSLPHKLIQLVAIVLEFGGESLLLHLLSVLTRKIDANVELKPEAKDFLLKTINVVINNFQYLHIIHRAFFYLNAGKYQISKRVTGINYVLVRYWLNANHSVKGYRILGYVTMFNVLTSIAIKLREAAINPLTPKQPQNSLEVSSETSTHRKCTLCLELRSSVTSTQCGHLFCWNCVCDWLQYRHECPICREACVPSTVIMLKNLK